MNCDWPAASVVVCTNRPWECSKACRESLLCQALPGRCFEILVVDNSTQPRPFPDQPNPSSSAAMPRWLREPRTGLSHARNHGASQAKAPIIAYIDDDATALSGWLENLLRAFDADPALAAIGGSVELALPAVLPRWYDGVLDGWFSRFDPPAGGVVAVRGFGGLPYGANLAIRRSAWEQLGGFDTRLGRRGADLAGGEDLDFCLRAMKAGCRVCTTSAARVLHHITADRITLRNLWRVSREAGLSLARLDPDGSRGNYLWRAITLLLKSGYPLRSIALGRRLNYLLRSRLYFAAAVHAYRVGRR